MKEEEVLEVEEVEIAELPEETVEPRIDTLEVDALS